MVPLQVAVPGGVELLVILLVALVVFGVPVVLVGAGLYLYRQSRSDRPAGEEIASLRREVERLREEVDRLDDEK
ncbi:preprotein translocase subunit TatA [Halorussus sp. AFM4]|uniref:preprotein translocase subunit TatA n=1 Tax=Halorussus sp. AFM4 TaxID=3421651 RepID=UPI003EBC7617